MFTAAKKKCALVRFRHSSVKALDPFLLIPPVLAVLYYNSHSLFLDTSHYHTFN